jgi:hypothetical protein
VLLCDLNGSTGITNDSTIELVAARDGSVYHPQNATDSRGYAVFSAPLGTYTIRDQTPPSGFAPGSISFTFNSTSDLGNLRLVGASTGGGGSSVTGDLQVLLCDLNGSMGIIGAEVTISGPDGTSRATTNGRGYADFGNHPAGHYTISASPEGWNAGSVGFDFGGTNLGNLRLGQ